MKRNILEEIKVMKNLFGYKRGTLISEQFDDYGLFTGSDISILKGSKFECMMDCDAFAACRFYFGDKSKNELRVQHSNGLDWSFTTDGRWGNIKNNKQGTWKCNLPPELPGFKIFLPTESKYYDSTTNEWKDDLSKVKVDPNVKPKVNPNNNSKNSGKTLYEIVQSEVDKCTGKNYVWKEVRKKYQEENPEGKEGSLQKNLKLMKDWKNGWRPKCAGDDIDSEPGGDEEKIDNINGADGEPGGDEVQPVEKISNINNERPLPQITVPKQIADYNSQKQTPFANVTPAEFYKKLYDGKMIKGDGRNTVRYMGPELKPEQQEKLTQAMTSMGYKFRRKGFDNRLVYDKIQ